MRRRDWKACGFCHQLKCTCGKKDYARRWVIDYRRLNQLTDQDAFPIPPIKQLLALAPRWKKFFKIDIEWAFHTVPVPEEDRHKLAFVTSQGIFEWCVMPFGAMNAPATWQRIMQQHLNGLGVLFYLDDILGGGQTDKECWDLARATLDRLRLMGVRAKLKKCSFNVDQVAYLGYIVKDGQIAVDPAKTQGIKDFPVLDTKEDIRRFIGLTQFYREFYPHFSSVAAPLTDLLKKDAICPPLTPAAKKAETLIKAYWSNPANLAVYRPDEPLRIYTDASDMGYGFVLDQGHGPIVFGSGKFAPSERAWDTTDREMYAFIQAFEKYPYYFTGEVTWYTDHKALLALKRAIADSPRRIRWSEKIANTVGWFGRFEIKHVPGTENHADGLTRWSGAKPIDKGAGLMFDPAVFGVSA